MPLFARSACANLLRRLRPEVVLTRDPRDPDDHRRVATELLAGLTDVALSDLPRRLYRCETHGGIHDPLGLGARIVDVTAPYELKLQALAAHESFTGSGFAALVERRSRFWGVQVGVERAEAFLPLPILGRLPAASHL